MCNCEWREIGTAPKDGTAVIAWRRHATVPLIVRFDASYGEFEDGFGDHVYNLSHWMPLPQAPNAAPAVAQDARDAARYRWLRGPAEESSRYSRWKIEYWDGPNGWQPMQRERMDAAIDAAMQGDRHEV